MSTTTDQNFTKVRDAGNIERKTLNELVDALETVLQGRRREVHSEVADAGKVALNDGSADESRVATVINTTSGEAAHVYLDATDNEVVILSQSASTFGTTEDNDTTTNIYYDSGNSQFELNNEEGSAQSYVVNYEGEAVSA